MAYLDTVKTAQQVVARDGSGDALSNALDVAAAARAQAAGVTHSEYVGYAAGMTNYQLRSDIEPLAEKQARDFGTVTQQDFRRAGTGAVAVFTSPGDQNDAKP